MSAVDRPDISELQEDLGPVVTEPIKNPFDAPGITPRGPTIKTPEGVPMNLTPPVASGAPTNEIVLDMPVLVIRFGRGKCTVQDPIGTVVAIDDAPSKMKDGSSSLELANLLRTALTSTTTIEFDKIDESNPEIKDITFTESRTISDAIVKWSVELGKP